MSLRHLLIITTLFFVSQIALAKKQVSIAGYGGNDVFAMKLLLEETLKEQLDAKNIDVSYFAIESDYPKYILNALSSGNAPDAFYVNTDVAQSWIKTGQLLPLPEILTTARSDMQPRVLDTFTHNGRLYAVPKDMNAIALVYNVDVFTDAGVDVPNNDDDWFDLKRKLQDVVDTLGDEGVTGLCISSDFNRFAPFALATGWQPFDQNGRTILDSHFKRAFSFYLSLHKDGLAVMPSDLGQNWGGGCLAIERTAIAIEGSWVAGYLRDKAPNLLFGSTLLPADPLSKQRGNLLFSAGWAVNKNAKDIEATLDVIELLTSVQAQSTILSSGLAIPSSLSLDTHPFFAADAPNNQLAKAIQLGTLVENTMTFSFGDYGNQWLDPIQIALSSVMLGQLSEAQAIAEAQAAYDAMYQRKGENQ